MNTKFNKIVKTAAVGIFFMALLMNVKVSLTDPFVTINNDVFAQYNISSGSGEVKCYRILQGFDGQSVSCSPCYLATGIPPWYHFGGYCTPA